MLRNRLSTGAHSSRPRPAAGAVLAVGALSLLAACGGKNSSAAIPTPSVSASPSSTEPSSAPTSASTTEPTAAPSTAAPTASRTTVVGTADCQSRHLALQAGQSQGAAGSTIATFILRNAGTTPCGLFGFPGVSFLNSSGARLGAAGTRQGTAAARFIVQPGQVASFQVQIPVAGCAPNSPQSTTIRVYPPNQKAALEAPAAFPICSAPSVTAVKSGITQ
jgi:hypothetical protein